MPKEEKVIVMTHLEYDEMMYQLDLVKANLTEVLNQLTLLNSDKQKHEAAAMPPLAA